MNNFFNSSANIPEPEGKMDTSPDYVDDLNTNNKKQVSFGNNKQVKFGNITPVKFGTKKKVNFGTKKKVNFGTKSKDKKLKKLLLEQIHIQNQLIELLLQDE